ncbi:MAG: tetratricopeptide repeat protein [Bdellovibrionales bacterium]|nr:tetratricopeptide repeat protein [Bdellovibrionales bacterium]
MAKHKKQNIDVKSPDLFVSTADQIGKFLSDNIKPIMALVLVALLIGVGATSWRNYSEYKEEKAAEALFGLEKNRRDIEEKFQKELMESNKDKKQEAKTVAEKIDFTQLEPLAQKFIEFSNQNKGTVAGATARIDAADIYFEYEKFDLSAKTLQEYLGSVDQKHFVYSLMLMQIGSSQVAMKNFDEAISSFKKVVDNEKVDFLRPEGLLKLGIAYKLKNDFENAKSSFLELTEKYSETEAGREAKSYLNLLKYQEQSSQG